MKLITKFISIIITLSVVMNVLVILPVSAETELITNFSGVPLDVKAKLYNDDGLKYKYNFVFRYKDGCYAVIFINDMFSITNTQNIDDIAFFEFWSTNAMHIRDSDGTSATTQSNFILFFNGDGSYRTFTNGSGSLYGISSFYNYSSATDKVQNAVDNIIYSDFDVQYNGLTVYQTSNNKAVSIADIIELGAGDGTGEIVGPQLAPIDHRLYGQYMDKNEETWSAFIQWLIDTGQYTELATYGLTATADNIQSLANTWWNNKFSPTLFFNLVKTNGVNTIANAENVMSWFNTKWQQYINHNYVKVPVGEEANSDPHHRANLMTDQTDENGNITDTTEVSLLREIVRQLETLPLRIASSVFGMFYSLIDNIATNTYAIASSLNVLPQQLANMIYNNFVDPLNAIIQAIQSKDNDININHDVDYNTTFQDVQYTLRNKFAFYHQLTEVKTILETTEFSEDKPFLTLAGYQLDFSLFDENREVIHKIIVTLAYLNFFLNLLRSLPVYIGGI